MEFQFRLMSVDGIPPWGAERGRPHLSWFGLTLGWFWIEVGGQELFRYSPEFREYQQRQYPQWAQAPLPYADYEDYQVVRYWEDLLERLPAILEPLPDDLAARVDAAEEWLSWQAQAVAWQERQADESAWNTYFAAVGWWSERTWDAGHLKYPPRLWVWREQDTVMVRWDNRDVAVEGIPVWTARRGEIALPVGKFLAAVTSFHRRFLAEMESRITETERVRSRPHIEIDFPMLKGEQQDRFRRLEGALQPRTSSWKEARAAITVIDQELERDRRRLLEADNLIAAGDRHFHADTPTFEEAQSLYHEALLLRMAARGEQHESVAVAMNRLANVYYQQQNQEAAGTLFERALAIREIVLPPDAPDLRLSVNNLANVYRNQGRFAEAEPLYRRSLRMREQEAGHADHPAIWRNLVRVLEGQGKLAEAAEYLQRIQLFEAAQSG